MSCIIKLFLCALTLAIITRTNGNTNRANISPNHINTLLSELQSQLLDPILFWNLVTLQACANDYDTSIVSTPDQVGPATTTRAFAIIHGAMFNSMNSFVQSYEQVAGSSGVSTTNAVSKRCGMTAAILEAAYQTLSSLYPKQRPIFDAAYRLHLDQTKNCTQAQTEISMGLTVGHLTASFILENRASDGSNSNDYYTSLMLPGYHQPDPTQTNQGYIGAHW